MFLEVVEVSVGYTVTSFSIYCFKIKGAKYASVLGTKVYRILLKLYWLEDDSDYERGCDFWSVTMGGHIMQCDSRRGAVRES